MAKTGDLFKFVHLMTPLVLTSDEYGSITVGERAARILLEYFLVYCAFIFSDYGTDGARSAYCYGKSGKGNPRQV